MSEGLPTKQCVDCLQVIPLYDFFRCKQSHDGLSPKCKACKKKRRSKSPIELIRLQGHIETTSINYFFRKK
jgi:NAD-dependent SIR2 family protein deacetylase